MIRAAKKRLKVTCDIAAYQTLLDDSVLSGFDTNFKVNPPLREKQDNDALLKALKDGTIDIICSGHTPHEVEIKDQEFDLADFGMINLQTFGANLLVLSRVLGWETIIEKITTNPRKLLGLEVPKIEVGVKANLTLFDPTVKWIFNESTNLSKSKNSPWLNTEITGKPMAVFNNGRVLINE
jgi:dihydroorotase